MSQNVLQPRAYAALNIDSLNRPVIDHGATASDIDNGNIFTLDSKYTSGSLTEVWEVTAPTSASDANLWMAYSNDEVILTSAKFKGIDPDVRNFKNEANKVFSAIKPQIGDIYVMTADGFSNTFSSHTYASCIDGSFKLYWQSAAAAAGLDFKYIATTYISIHTSSSTIDMQRTTAYELECIQI